jgi:hypothetical protein
MDNGSFLDPDGADYPVALAVAAALLDAHDQGSGRHENEWTHAVTLPQLRALGAGDGTLVRLVRCGYLQHRKASKPGQPNGVGTSSGGRIAEGSRFLLSPGGLIWARDLTSQNGVAANATVSLTRLKLPHRPQYDRQRRVLWWGDHEVLAFDRPAPGMEAIVSKFEESSWCERVDSPLSKMRNGKERLRDTVRRLNKATKIKLIRFRTDGYGQGVCWERYH